MKTKESIEQFLNRGGKIQVCKCTAESTVRKNVWKKGCAPEDAEGTVEIETAKVEQGDVSIKVNR